MIRKVSCCKKMKRIIWISPHLPYDMVGHAGGMTQNYYIHKLIDSNLFDVELLSFYWDNEMASFSLGKVIKCFLVPYHSSGLKKIWRNLYDIEYQRNPFNRYGNLTSKYLKTNILRILQNEKKRGNTPEIIVLQWTQIILFAKEIKQIYPTAKIIGIEEDVSFLSYKRRIGLSGNRVTRYAARKRYESVRREELNALDYCDIVICNNRKDQKILRKNNYEGDIRVWAPFYRSFRTVEREPGIKKSIIFYGDMGRPENYLSAEWFADNVMPTLVDEDLVFDIIGGKNPDKSLFECASRHKNVRVHGFVENIHQCFAQGLCLVAPLLYGAGIKVKVLEAMSSGLPVLTNHVGIEGIPARGMMDYIYCGSPEDYVIFIRKLLTDKELGEKLGRNSRDLVRCSFDYEKSAKEFIEWLN